MSAHPEPGRDFCWGCRDELSLVDLDPEGYCAACVHGRFVLAAESDEEYDRIAELGPEHFEREIARVVGKETHYMCDECVRYVPWQHRHDAGGVGAS